MNKTIHKLFEDQVLKNPNNVALVYEGKKLTYFELNSKANQLANYLQKQYYIKPDDLIALCLDKSEHMLIAILAVLKSGGAYVPIDPSYPDERIRYILKDTATKVVLTNDIYHDKLKRVFSPSSAVISNSVLALDKVEFQVLLSKENILNPQTLVTDHNLAYVIYTSGTTGAPKGVMIEHASYTNVISYFKQTYFNTVSQITTYSITNYTFDVFGLEYGLVLLNGGCLELGNILFTALDAGKYSFIQFTPSGLAMKYSEIYNKSKLSLLIGGETLLPSLKEKLLKDKVAKIVNVYGPTETTIWSTSKLITDKEHISHKIIGQPIANTTCYVLDDSLSCIPVNTIGELYVGGIGLARGYLNQPELTQARFIINPFQTQEEKTLGINSRLYKTGDLVKLLSNGDLEYIDRSDFQVKIRGYRIELGEIENALNSYFKIQQSIVLALEHKDGLGNLTGDKYLVAYYIPELELDENEIRIYLADKLPKYMFPNMLVALDKFPLTINGKIDRKALPLPDFIKDYAAPRNELESKICGIFAMVLNLPFNAVSIDTDFFRLGGTSILAIKLINKLHELGINTSIAAIFKYRTIKELVTSFNHEDTLPLITNYSDLKPEEYKLSFAQERLWFIQRFAEKNTAYNIPLLFKLNQNCNTTLLLNNICNVVKRHEVLRTLFKQDNEGNAYQLVTENNIKIAEYDVDTIEHLHHCMQQDINYIFDLEHNIPIRVCHYCYNNEDYLTILIHHVAFDGWSTGVFMQDLIAFYQSSQLPDLSIQYKDFALWQRSYLTNERLTNQLTYWQNKLLDFESLNLPIDKRRPTKFDYLGDLFEFELSKDLSMKLRNLSKKLKVSLYSVLLSGFYLTLRAYSNQEDITLGTIVSNRHYLQTENLIGFFVNTLVLRQQIDSNITLTDFITQVSNEVLEAQLNQDLPFERLVAELVKEKDTSRHPIFQVMFGVQHFGDTNNLFTFYKPSELLKTAKFDLTLLIDDSKEQLTANIEFATSIFNKESIKGYSETYQIILEQLVTNKQIKDIYYLSKETYQKIVIDYNKTYQDYPYKTVHQLFEEQVAKTPNNTALIFEDIQLTYYELNSKANQLAHYLYRQYQIKPDDLIALCLDRSEHMLIAILAVLKSGGAYVPIDPCYPNERIKYILQDTQPKVVLTNYKHHDKLKQIIISNQTKTLILTIDETRFQEILSIEDISNLQTLTKPNNLAYIIYTSGTTGVPNGVMVEHEALVAFCFKNIFLSCDKPHSIMGYSNYAFDGSVFDIFYSLCNGNKLVFILQDVMFSEYALRSVISLHKIDTIFLTTALFCSFLSLGKRNPLMQIENILFGGEKINVEALNMFGNNLNSTNLIHVYGPTENIVFSTFCKLSIDNLFVAPIGSRLNDKSLYVLNKHVISLPLGAIGELYIGGAGIASGYLNQPKLTQEKFIVNPFQTAEEKVSYKNAKLYKTGDLVRMLPNRYLEYIGRDDLQVKIKGYRIELSEIERILNKFPGIKQCAVLALDHENILGNPTGDKYLVAYYEGELEVKSSDEATYVNNWISLYNMEYSQLKVDDYKKNISGWNSSYTREAIAKDEMLEWRDETVKRIKTLNPGRILEVGSGTGLLLFSLIDECTYYYATDFSDYAIMYINNVVNKLCYQKRVTVIKCNADKLPFDTIKCDYDTVIINSVTQYFPNLGYLENVLNNIINNINGKGKIFIGDVRDYRLLECFHYSILKFNQIKVIPEKVDYFKVREKELLISPEYFVYLQQNNPLISRIELLPKLGNAFNEMNCYRYDVVLHICKHKYTGCKILKNNNFVKVLNMKEYLNSNKHNNNLYIKYPNYRIVSDYVSYGELCGTNHYHLDLLQANSNFFSLNYLKKIFGKLDYDVRFYLDAIDPVFLNIVAYRDDNIRGIIIEYDKFYPSKSGIANNPLKGLKLLENQLNDDIMSYLKTRLPNYMLPNHLISLDKFPLTYNGKIDRNKLINPELIVSDNYIKPRNKLESIVCEIMSQVICLPKYRIGVKDDFFRIGGNSILAIKLATKLNNKFNCDLGAIDIFLNQTIEKLSVLVSKYRKEFFH